MKKALLFLLLSINSLVLFAQVLTPAKWTAKISKQEAAIGETLEIIFECSIDKNWYIYSADLNPNIGPIPTTFKFKKDAGFEVLGNIKQVTKPTRKYDAVWEDTIPFFKNKASFSQKIKILAPNPNITAFVDGQTCTEVDGKCIQFDDEFTFKIATTAQVETKNPPIKEVAKTPENNNNLTENKTSQTGNTNNTQIIVKDSVVTANTDTINNNTTTQIETPNTISTTTEETPEEPSLLSFALFAFLGGLAALLTPCVFPMIPMTVSFFTSKQKKRSQGIIQAMFYGASIIGIYTFIGFLVSRLFGADAANWLATHWIPNVLFFLIFLVFAFSFFGAYEIVMPHQLVNAIDAKSEKGGFIGVFFMAFTLVLVSFSCTGPIAGSILVASANGQILKPVVGMFAFSAAFAIPFTLFALFPSWLQTLPKSGGWLNSIKVVLGFIELALALKFLSVADQVYHWEILPRHIYLAFWIAIFSLMGLYLLGKIRLSHDSKEEHIGTVRLISAVLTFTFVVYLIPGMFGAPLKALAGYLPPQTTLEFDLMSNRPSAATSQITKPVRFGDKFKLPHGLQGYFDYNEALKASQEQNKPIFIDFTGHGCVNCREMEAVVWSNPAVLQRLQNDFVILALYVDDPTELPENEWVVSKYDNKTKKTIGKINSDLEITYFNNNAQPYYIILGKEGLQAPPLVKPRAYNLNSDEFVKFLEEAKQKFGGK